MQYSIVNLNELKNTTDSFRIDAEYLASNILYEEKLIKIKNGKKLKDLCQKIFSGPFGSSLKSSEYLNSGIPFIRILNMENFFLKRDELFYISKENNTKLKSSEITKDDIIISKIGTIGVVSILTQDIGNNANISENNIGIKTKNIDPKFLLVFLNSSIGQHQILRFKSGNVQPKLNISDIENIFIPIPSILFQSKIADLVNNSYSLRQSADNLYQEAENILLEELGLKDYIPQNKKCFTKKLSDTQKAGRFDAEYFQPKYEDVIKKIKGYKGGYEILEYFIKNYSTGYPYKSEEYQDFGIPVIRIANIGKNKLELENNPVFISKKYSNISKKDIAKAGNILISMSGTIGNTAEIPESVGKCCINQRVLSFESENINNKCLVLFLNSFFGHLQFERIGVGGLQINLSYNDVKNLLIPLLSPSIQSVISTKIQESFANREKSKQLLEIAKKAVEIAIEENEEKGLDYIKNNNC